jgi:hypothetical protein
MGGFQPAAYEPGDVGALELEQHLAVASRNTVTGGTSGVE